MKFYLFNLVNKVILSLWFANHSSMVEINSELILSIFVYNAIDYL